MYTAGNYKSENTYANTLIPLRKISGKKRIALKIAIDMSDNIRADVWVPRAGYVYKT